MPYTELLAQVKGDFEADSTEFTNAIPQRITLAESRIFKDAPNLPAFRTTATGTISSATLTVPVGLRTTRGFRITVGSNEVFLERRIDSYIKDKYPATTSTAQPVYYSEINETTMLFGPTPNTSYAYTLYYLRVPTGLSASNATTWLGTTHEDILLYATNWECAAFLVDEGAVAYWKSRYEEEVARLGAEVKRIYLNEYGAGA